MTPRNEVRLFAKDMERELRKHDRERGKAGWRNCTPGWLYGRLREEMEELGDEFDPVNPGDLNPFEPSTDVAEIVKECANVANFAMMIADVARRLR